MAGCALEPKRASQERAPWPSRAFHATAFERLGAMATRRAVDAGQTLFIEHDRAREFFIVRGGCIKTYKMLLDGRRQITEFAFRDDLLGLPVRNGHYAFTAEAVTSACVSRVPIERFENLAASWPEFTLGFMEFISNELAFAHDQLLLLGRKNAEEKVASFLLGLLRRQYARGMHGNRIHLSMPQMDIADFLGIRHETVSRALAVLRRKRVIAFATSDEVLVENHTRLMELAGVDDEPVFAAPAGNGGGGSRRSIAAPGRGGA